MNSRIITALPAALAVAALAACTFGTPTVPADELADTAEGALEEEVGQRPEIDCGGEDIEVVEGEDVTCVLTDPASGTEYDTVITFTSVDGTDFEIDVQVADTAN
ncbi:DUF4333 domain-containing protein [Glycomyces sp. NPDC048151]|uniref:DUF4333 domain-containing protein n=1 Tax=Glycomyces sp. NPDC048151 TaxID=3364002 RepID=UPI0037112880